MSFIHLAWNLKRVIVQWVGTEKHTNSHTYLLNIGAGKEKLRATMVLTVYTSSTSDRKLPDHQELQGGAKTSSGDEGTGEDQLGRPTAQLLPSDRRP